MKCTLPAGVNKRPHINNSLGARTKVNNMNSHAVLAGTMLALGYLQLNQPCGHP